MILTRRNRTLPSQVNYLPSVPAAVVDTTLGETVVSVGVEAAGDGSVRATFLGWKSVDSVAFGNPRFSGGKSYQ